MWHQSCEGSRGLNTWPRGEGPGGRGVHQPGRHCFVTKVWPVWLRWVSSTYLPVSTLHYPARCPSEADLWGLSHWASLSCGVQWVQPTRGFSGRSKRERHIWVSYVPSSLVYCRLFVSPHQWPRGSCHTALSQQLFSLSSSTYSPAFSPQAVQKGWQRIPTVASPRILQHPSLVSLCLLAPWQQSLY